METLTLLGGNTFLLFSGGDAPKGGAFLRAANLLMGIPVFVILG